jgi:hypothetical protein
MKKPVAVIVTCLLATSFAFASAHGAVLLGTNAKPTVAVSKSRVVAPSAVKMKQQSLQLKGNANAKALNPQPLPPGPDKAAARASMNNKMSVTAKRVQSMQRQNLGGAASR